MDWSNLNFDHLGTTIASLAVVYGVNILGAILIAIGGRWLAGVTERLTRRMLLEAAHTDPTITVFLSSLAYYSVLVLTFLLILQMIGVQATSLVAVAGATSLAIGLALQGTLTNLAAGVMLLLFRPFRLGDNIEVSGKNGTVRGLNIFMTELASGENVQILIPNAQVWGTAISNFSSYPVSARRVALNVPVPPAVAMTMREAMKHYLDTETRVLPTPAATVTLATISEKGVEIAVQAWARPADADQLKQTMVERFVAALQGPSPAAQVATTEA